MATHNKRKKIKIIGPCLADELQENIDSWISTSEYEIGIISTSLSRASYGTTVISIVYEHVYPTTPTTNLGPG